jgi:hypothetical protein
VDWFGCPNPVHNKRCPKLEVESYISDCYPLNTGFSLRQIHHNRITCPHQILRRDHDLLAPLARASAEDGFFNQARLEEGSESWWLPAKSRDGADDVSRCLFYHFGRGHLNITRANCLLEMS